MVLYSKFSYGSQFLEQKNGLNLFLGCLDIQQTMKYRNYYTFFMGHPLYLVFIADE